MEYTKRSRSDPIRATHGAKLKTAAADNAAITGATNAPQNPPFVHHVPRGIQRPESTRSIRRPDGAFVVETCRWLDARICLSLAMAIAENHPPFSLGLGGDGDEIAAISAVEQCFGVRLDYSGSQSWTTVGDVFDALQRALSTERAAAHDTWERFAEAISLETGVDSSQVTHETLLLGQHRFDRRVLLVVAILIGLTLAVVRHW